MRHGTVGFSVEPMGGVRKGENGRKQYLQFPLDRKSHTWFLFSEMPVLCEILSPDVNVTGLLTDFGLEVGEELHRKRFISLTQDYRSIAGKL